MTSYRLMDGLSGRPGNGPATATSYSGNYLAGVGFGVSTGGLWFTGYYWWCCNTGQQTTAQKFALWQITSAGSNGVLIPGSVVTSGVLTAGAWNYVPLPSPLPLSPNSGVASSSGPWYQACTGYVSSTGFPETDNQFGSAEPFAAGITNGPLFAYGNSPGVSNAPAQSQFSTGGSDPSVNMPLSAFNDANFWMDLQLTDQAPAGASYQLFPNQPVPPSQTNDTANNFTLGAEFILSQPCSLNRIWFYSPSIATQLPTETGIWSIAGQSLVPGTHLTSPSWSGAAGSGWVSASYPGGVTLNAGTKYKTSVFNGAVTPSIWNVSFIQYWNNGPGANGLTTGPLAAPNVASATLPGQDTYHQGVTFAYPDTYDNTGTGDNYWVDVEVTPVTAQPATPLYSMRMMP